MYLSSNRVHCSVTVLVLLQTLADIVRAAKAPEPLLEYSDVQHCQNVLEPVELERLPPKIKFLIIIGASCPQL